MSQASRQRERGNRVRKAIRYCYSKHILKHQAMFVIQAQAEFKLLTQLKRHQNIIADLEQMQNFAKYQGRLKQSPAYFNKKTLCIDLLTVFLVELRIEEQEDF